MCDVSPAASFYFVFVSSELPALCGKKVVQYNNVLYKFLSLPREKIQIPHSLETLTRQIPHSHGTNLWSNAWGSQWGGGFYGYRLKFWLFYGYRLIFFSYG